MTRGRRRFLLCSIAPVGVAILSGLPSVAAAFVGNPSPLQQGANFLFPDTVSGHTSSRRELVIVQAGQRREDEIRRKISQLKRQGKIKNQPSIPQDDGTRKSATPVAEQYGNQLRKKLGTKKAKLLGTTMVGDFDEEDELVAELDQEEDTTLQQSTGRQARLGTLPRQDEDDDQEAQSSYIPPTEYSSPTEYKNYDASLFDTDYEDTEALSEEELVEMVAEKLAEKRRQEQREKEARIKEDARKRLAELEQERLELQQQQQQAEGGQTTTGIGGSWTKNEETSEADYKPSKSGTWGVFERPKDISRAFGGGKRVGAGYTPDNLNKKKSEEDTRARLRQYREKVGIEVQSEKDHAAEIDQALAIGKRAMERGIYNTAVSALEKVTKWCSTNSVLGGKVFLELAMAYEAVGRTQEAITVYSTLSRSRIEEVKFNAKRLLYGIEAMQFMRNEARSPEFSRKKIKNTFIDTTGLANIAQNFDDVYNTAYIDLDSGFYRRLTESVVRSNREARQILLKATGAGEVERLKVVQALRSISRHFDDALEEEILSKKPVEEPVAVMNGKPILAEPARPKKSDLERMMGSMDEFALASPEQMLENLDGEWRLQLLADKRGDGVKYYNTSFSWQNIDSQAMSFTSSGTAGFLTVAQSGGIEFQEKRRILKRTDLSVSGTGGMLSGFLAKGSGGAAGAVSVPHQIVSVDSVLLITRMAPTSEKKKFDDSTKEYFAVWRRIDPSSAFSEATP